jgi:hypothetical protein
MAGNKGLLQVAATRGFFKRGILQRYVVVFASKTGSMSAAR